LFCSLHFHFLEADNWMLEVKWKILLPFWIKRMNFVIHSCNIYRFWHINHSNRFWLNIISLITQPPIFNHIYFTISTRHVYSVIHIQLPSRLYKNRYRGQLNPFSFLNSWRLHNNDIFRFCSYEQMALSLFILEPFINFWETGYEVWLF